jgi:hypothetical protein
MDIRRNTGFRYNTVCYRNVKFLNENHGEGEETQVNGIHVKIAELTLQYFFLHLVQGRQLWQYNLMFNDCGKLGKMFNVFTKLSSGDLAEKV